MPTAPVHHGCAASQAITSTPSACSRATYSSSDDAVAVAGSGDVDPSAGVAVRGKPSVHGLVAEAGAVATAVRDVLEDRRHRRALAGIDRQEQASGEAPAVGEGHEDGLDLA